MTKKFQYNFSGLKIVSDVSLQLIDESPFLAKPDLKIKFDPKIKIAEDKKAFTCNLNKTSLNYPNVGAINIGKNGNLLTYNYVECNLNFLSKIINHGIGYSYYQRRKLALHGSAINVKKYAVLFMGESGTGKSSMLASLSKNFQCLSDDTIGLDFNDQGVSLYPGINYFKIDQTIADVIGINKEKIVINDDRHRSFYKSGNLVEGSIVVRSCYILRWGDEDAIVEIVNPKEKIAAVLQSAYTCFPLNTCIESASLLMNLSSFFFENVKMYYFIRKKGNILSNTEMLIKHING